MTARKLYCSEDCRRLARSRRRSPQVFERTCSECGADLPPHVGLRSRPRVVCSTDCARMRRNRLKSPTKVVNCQDCGEELMRPHKVGALPRRCERCSHLRQQERSRVANQQLRSNPERYERAKERARQRARSLTAAQKRQSSLWSNYRMRIEDYEALLDEQDSACASCGQLPEGRGKEPVLVVDHCHDTGRVRGLLCGNCNSALGLMHENANYLRGLIAYIESRC